MPYTVCYLIFDVANCSSGVNLPTERAYFYQKSPRGGLTFDKNPGITVEGLKISHGIGYEIESMLQNFVVVI